jgi:hypothetical protein
MAKLCIEIISPSNKDSFQHIRIPPDAPDEGAKANLLNLFALNFFIRSFVYLA